MMVECCIWEGSWDSRHGRCGSISKTCRSFGSEALAALRGSRSVIGDDNAPLLVALGSHRLGRVPTAEIPAAVARLATARCLAQAGDVWVYATTIIHASERTRNPARRRVLQVDFSAGELAGGLEWLGIANE